MVNTHMISIECATELSGQGLQQTRAAHLDVRRGFGQLDDAGHAILKAFTTELCQDDRQDGMCVADQ